MTNHFNIRTMKDRRKFLRNNSTKAENILWAHLKNSQLLGYKFRRQYSIDFFILDFYSPELKLAIELDGKIHELTGHPEYDSKRQQYIEGAGITLIRYKNDQIYKNIDIVKDEIIECIIRLTNSKKQ